MSHQEYNSHVPGCQQGTVYPLLPEGFRRQLINFSGRQGCGKKPASNTGIAMNEFTVKVCSIIEDCLNFYQHTKVTKV